MCIYTGGTVSLMLSRENSEVWRHVWYNVYLASAMDDLLLPSRRRLLTGPTICFGTFASTGLNLGIRHK
jgi:hypothetical protein